MSDRPATPPPTDLTGADETLYRVTYDGPKPGQFFSNYGDLEWADRFAAGLRVSGRHQHVEITGSAVRWGFPPLVAARLAGPGQVIVDADWYEAARKLIDTCSSYRCDSVPPNDPRDLVCRRCFADSLRRALLPDPGRNPARTPDDPAHAPPAAHTGTGHDQGPPQ